MSCGTSVKLLTNEDGYIQSNMPGRIKAQKMGSCFENCRSLQLSVPLENTNNVQYYISSILDTGTNKTMIVFTDGPAQLNPGPAGSGVIIKKQV